LKKEGILISLIITILIVVSISGCADSSKEYNKNGVSFSYPNTWNISSENGSSTDFYVQFEGEDILIAEVSGWKLQPNETMQDYISVHDNMDFYDIEVNGYTYYEGYYRDEGMVYNRGYLEKDGIMYTIYVAGNVDSLSDYEKIRDSFKIE
jgi:hypothetical protein